MKDVPPTNNNNINIDASDATGHHHIERQNNNHERSPARSLSSTTTTGSSPSFLQCWSARITLPLATCGGCLSQVEEEQQEADCDNTVDNTIIATTTITTPPRTPSSSRESNSGLTLNHREGCDNAARSSANSRKDDCDNASSTTLCNNTDNIIIHQDDIAQPSCDESVEVPTDQNCPICLHHMSTTADILHPIQCPNKKSCRYNFCLDCMEALVKSSKEDYQIASDGSRRVKIKLSCPNCRADIAGIIEHAIQIRKEALGLVDEMDKQLARKPPSSNFKNRSSALPRLVHEKRITDLIQKVASMPTPSSVRDQVLAVHYGGRIERGIMGSSSYGASSSYADDESLSSSIDVQVVQPLSSTLSSPILTSLSSSRGDGSTANDFGTPTSSSRKSFNMSLKSATDQSSSSSPQVKKLVMATPTRRTRSFESPASPSLLIKSSKITNNKKKKQSPRRVLDLFGYDEESNRGDNRPSSSGHTRKSTNDVCLEGINFADGDTSFFADAINLDWCCSGGYNDTSDNSIDIASMKSFNPKTTRSRSRSIGKVSEQEGCGGYIDYGGVYHTCTNRPQQEERDSRGSIHNSDPCQGCVFRLGMCTDFKYEDNEPELYYDSDPGQHFNIGWSHKLPTQLPPPTRSTSGGLLDETVTPSKGASIGKRAKLPWKRRMRKSGSQSKSSSPSSRLQGGSFRSSTAEIAQQGREEQTDQQAYLYDYFSRQQTNNDTAKDMRTGFCSTKETDVGKFVQVRVV